MENQFKRLGVVIRSFRLGAVSAKDKNKFSDGDALLLSKLFELETEINIARSDVVVLKTLCALGLERPDQVNLSSSSGSLLRYNNLVELQTVFKLATKAACEGRAFKLSTEAFNIFDEESRETKSAENFDKILKLIQLLGESVQQLQELAETQQKLNANKLKINQRLLKEKHDFCEELDKQRIQLEEKQNIDKDLKMEIVNKIHSKLNKTNTTRMLTNILITVSNIDFNQKQPYIKLLQKCRNPATMESL